MEERLPQKPEEESRVVEAEVVGHEPLPPLGRRVASRLAAGLVMGVLGAVLFLLGAALTLTLVGAPVGIPLMLAGLALVFAALFAPFGRGRARIISMRWPPSDFR